MDMDLVQVLEPVTAGRDASDWSEILTTRLSILPCPAVYAREEVMLPAKDGGRVSTRNGN